MLAVVKKPRIELSLQGEDIDELIDWIGQKFEVSILTSDKSDSVPIEETDFWKAAFRRKMTVNPFFFQSGQKYGRHCIVLNGLYDLRPTYIC